MPQHTKDDPADSTEVPRRESGWISLTAPEPSFMIQPMFFLYEAVLYLVFIALLPWFFITGLMRGKYVGSFSERMGKFRTSPSSHDLWIHAVSVGETLAARPLVAALQRNRPGIRIVFTTTTATGRDMAKRFLPDVTHSYFPFDFTASVNRFLDHHRPAAFAAMETEIWPNVTRLTSRRGISLLLVNARISDRSFPRYRRFRRFLRPILERYTSFLARDEEDARRLVAIGAPARRVEVIGNLKFDYQPGTQPLPVEQWLLALADHRKILVLGSTIAGEDELIIPGLGQFIAESNGFVVIAPRRPERFEVVAALLRAAEIPFVKRSEMPSEPSASVPHADLLLVDSIGELAALYRHAAVAFIGGSLVPAGGHNPIEPAALGVPSAFGPSMSNFREIADLFLRSEASVEVASDQQLFGFARRILEDQKLGAAYSARALEAVSRNRGAADRAANRILELLG